MAEPQHFLSSVGHIGEEILYFWLNSRPDCMYHQSVRRFFHVFIHANGVLLVEKKIRWASYAMHNKPPFPAGP